MTVALIHNEQERRLRSSGDQLSHEYASVPEGRWKSAGGASHRLGNREYSAPEGRRGNYAVAVFRFPPPGRGGLTIDPIRWLAPPANLRCASGTIRVSQWSSESEVRIVESLPEGWTFRSLAGPPHDPPKMPGSA